MSRVKVGEYIELLRSFTWVGPEYTAGSRWEVLDVRNGPLIRFPNYFFVHEDEGLIWRRCNAPSHVQTAAQAQDTIKPTVQSCKHVLREYIGLIDRYNYCINCNKREDQL